MAGKRKNRSGNRRRKPPGVPVSNFKTLANGVPTDVGGVTLVRQGNRVGIVKGKP